MKLKHFDQINENLIWTGIGSRSVHPSVYQQMVKFGQFMASTGAVLRSGAAGGSDEAFQIGYETFLFKTGKSIDMEIYTPWKNFINTNTKTTSFNIDGSRLESFEAAKTLARAVHPIGNKLNGPALALHARNTYQVLGGHHTEPSDFVIYYADEHNGIVSGGTATAVEVARRHHIPVYNIKIDKGDEQIRELWSKIVNG